jgi:ketosteroid isomerase-like protein
MRSLSAHHPTADDVEQSFYEAMQTAQLEALMQCWADDEEPVCVHPGGPRLVGLAAIRESFETVLANGPIRLHAHVVSRSVFGGCAVHSVLETVVIRTDDGMVEATLLATNVLVLTAHGWKMAAHHASPGPAQPVVITPSPHLH